ncbi:hypothetical protein B0H19DRAFT_1115800 [Mycena capillaripes]|nr:hypothetical protein B0H19DRAFT_1115800 [Mycena capillaripes]
MFRFIPRRGIARVLTQRSLHHDVYRPGRIFTVVHIDIGTAAQPLPSNPTVAVPPIPQPQNSPDSPPASSTASDPAVATEKEEKFSWVQECLGLLFLFMAAHLLRERTSPTGITGRVSQAARLVESAPDVVEQNEVVLAAHLDELARLLLPPEVYTKDYEPTRRRRRLEEDLGRTAMMETVAQLHAALERKGGKLAVNLDHIEDIFRAFTGASKPPGKGTHAEAESNGFSDSPEQPTDYPSLQV